MRNKRKYTTNEIEYIHKMLNKVFIQNFGFNISGKEILEEFEELGYNIFTKNGLWDSETKKLKPSTKGNVITSNESYAGYDACFIYIDIDQSIVKQLMTSTTVANPNTSEIKLEKEMKMKKELQSFKQNTLSKLQSLFNPNNQAS